MSATGIGGEVLWLCPSIDDSANDLSGNANNGTYIGSMGTVANTESGGTRAYSLNGSSQRISIASAVATVKPITFTAWIKAANTTAVKTVVAIGRGNTSRNILYMEVGNSAKLGAYQFTNATNFSAYEENNLYTTGWHYISVTYPSSGTTFTIRSGSTSYTNMTAGGIFSSNNITSPNLTSVGAFIDSNGSFLNFFNGLLDDVRIFTRVLTTDEHILLGSTRGYQHVTQNNNGIFAGNPI